MVYLGSGVVYTGIRNCIPEIWGCTHRNEEWYTAGNIIVDSANKTDKIAPQILDICLRLNKKALKDDKILSMMVL